MTLFPKIEQGMMIPWWSGVAYFDPMSRRVQCAPIGFAKLWGVSRNVYHWLQKPTTRTDYMMMEIKLRNLGRHAFDLRTALLQAEDNEKLGLAFFRRMARIIDRTTYAEPKAVLVMNLIDELERARTRKKVTDALDHV